MTARDIDLEALAARWAAPLERHRLVVLIPFSLAYFVIVLALAARKQFRYDELFTYYIATMPSVADIRQALGLDLDNHPLPFYLVTRFALNIVGNEHIAARLPGLVGVWFAALCLFTFVARRTNVLYGILAMASLFLTFATPYAYEARPYGLALGLTGLALIAWQAAAEGRRRTFWLIVLALAVAGIVSTSFYATLVVAPIAMAEIVRTRDRGRIDGPMWAGLGAGAATILFYLGDLGRGFDSFSNVTLATPWKMAVIVQYRRLFGDYVLVVVAFLVLVPLYLTLFRGGATREPTWERERFHRHEIVAAIGLLLIPVLAYVAAVFVVHAIAPRYILSSVFGFGILLSFAAFRITRGSSLFAIAFLVVAACIFGVIGVAFEWHTLGRERAQYQELRTLVAAQPADVPIAIANHEAAWDLMHHSRPETAARLYYVIPVPATVSTAELAAWRRRQTWLELPRHFPVQAEELRTFVDRHRRFLLLDPGWGTTRRLHSLLEMGAVVEIMAAGQGWRLYRVDATEAAGRTSRQAATPGDRSRDSPR